MLQHYGFVATKGVNCCNITTFEIRLQGTTLANIAIMVTIIYAF